MAKEVYLIGKIDRVDILNKGDNAFILEQQTINHLKRFKIKRYKRRNILQLMTYMYTLLDNKDKILNENTKNFYQLHLTILQ